MITHAPMVTFYRRNVVTLPTLILDKTVSHPPDSIEIFCGGTELFTEAAHVGIDGAGIDEAVVFPDIAEEVFAGLDAAAALGETREQFEFGGGQFARLAPPAHKMARGVDQEI